MNNSLYSLYSLPGVQAASSLPGMREGGTTTRGSASTVSNNIGLPSLSLFDWTAKPISNLTGRWLAEITNEKSVILLLSVRSGQGKRWRASTGSEELADKIFHSRIFPRFLIRTPDPAPLPPCLVLGLNIEHACYKKCPWCQFPASQTTPWCSSIFCF